MFSQGRLQQIAIALKTTPAELVGYQKEHYVNQRAREITQEIMENKQLELIFDAAKKVSPKDLDIVLTLLIALKQKGNTD